MEEQTFRSRLVELLSKSRKAVRLYSGISRSKRGSALAELQANEWLSINSELVTLLSSMLDDLSVKNLTSEASILLEQFLSRYQITVEEMHSKKRKLIEHAETSDFAQSVVLSRELVAIKARAQALQAVYNEIKATVKRSRPKVEPVTINEDELFTKIETEKPTMAKIIPLRQKISLG